MNIFAGIPPNAGNQSIQQGVRAIAEHAKKIRNGRAEWALSELGLDAEDSRWLFDWAGSLPPEVARFWLHKEQSPENLTAQTKAAAVFGTLLTLLAVESARAGLPQANNWPLPVSLQFAAGARPVLFLDNDPSPEHLHAIQLAVRELRLRRSAAEDPKQWLRETIVVQINPADIPPEKLPRWIPQTIASLNERNAKPIFHAPQILHPSQLFQATPPADLFGQLDAKPGVATIEQAVRAMLDRARENNLPQHPWSLTELRPTDYDYIWLRVWVTKLDGNTANYCGSPFRRFTWAGQEYPLQAAFGLLLMLWISEHARRLAEEGNLWRWIPQDAVDKSAAKILFAQKQPSATLKELLEMAARRFNLRHVFGRAGAQQWIDTIFLQFGFTRRGFERRLPEWLAGQTPTLAIEQLLAKETGSAGFRDCWETLCQYRRKDITYDRAANNLQITPWLLPEWKARALELAKEPIAKTTTSPRSSQPETERAENTFLTEPRLRWEPPTAPYFLSHLNRLDLLGLTEDVYHLAVNGRIQTQLLRQTDGGYAPADGDEITFPYETARVTVQLLDGTRQIAAAEDVELWPVGEDVTVFQLSDGSRLADAYAQPMSLHKTYAVLTAPDLQMEPRPDSYRVTADAKLFYLSVGWPAKTRVWLDDDLIWEPCFRQLSLQPPPVIPAWRKNLRLELDAAALNRQLRWGDKVHLKLHHPPEVELRFARHRGGPLEFERRNERCTRLGPMKLTSENGAGELQVQLGLRYQNQTYRITQEAKADVIGVAKLRNGIWEPLSERFVLKAGTARAANFKIAPPRKWDKQERKLGDWALMEGDLWLKSLSRLHTPIGEVAGLGAPLTLRLGPYNAERDAMTVAESVIDCGVIDRAWKADGELHLRLLHPVEAGEQHSILGWSEDGQIHQLLPAPSEAEPGDVWRCALPEETPEFVAVALTYEGWRLGAWWQPDWHCHLESLAKASPRATATLLRWFRLPLLSEKAVATVREIAARHPVEFLSLWLRESANPAFNLPAATEGRLAAIRSIFLDWTPDAQTAEALLDALSEPAETEEAFHGAAWRLLEADPRLLYKVLTAWLPNQPDQQSAMSRIRSLRLKIAEANDEKKYDQMRQLLLDQCANEWSVNSNFIDLGIVKRAVTSARGEKLSQRDEMNIALAISSESLRRLLAMSFLKQLA